MSNWLLPENFSDILPAEAWQIEKVRRRLLDLYKVHGFELVFPPLVEYIDSLLLESDRNLDLRTCKITDQLSGRTLGIRSDITPQISRIDAQLLNRSGVTRLCYYGSALHARPIDLLANREIFQTGAEIYGCSEIEADLEIIYLMLHTIDIIGISKPQLDLCHLGIIRSILLEDPAITQYSKYIITLLYEKNISGLIEFLKKVNSNSVTLTALELLPSLYGGIEVIDIARKGLPNFPGISNSLDLLQKLVDEISTVELINIDLAEVGSYGYHSGLTFKLYADGWHDSLINGGRYDHISSKFGRARMATGFSLDLRKLLTSKIKLDQPIGAIRAPYGKEIELLNTINQLRRAGEIVIQNLPGNESNQDGVFYNRKLVSNNGVWVVETL